MGFMASSRVTTKPSVLNQGPPAQVNLMDKIIGIETFFSTTEKHMPVICNLFVNSKINV